MDNPLRYLRLISLIESLEELVSYGEALFQYNTDAITKYIGSYIRIKVDR